MQMKGDMAEPVIFGFEEDFADADIRCIPMIVRFKLDACGIKLKLAEWSRMTVQERRHLTHARCEEPGHLMQFRDYLCKRITERTGNIPTTIPVPENPSWSRTDEIPYTVLEKLSEVSCVVTIDDWRRLTDLQRFALLKLSYGGHENKNFPKALLEFGLA
jgi:hypothetical protein